jgi:catechol 2,3-dioxygenase-like lactoylglutathione lyase family enzyme
MRLLNVEIHQIVPSRLTSLRKEPTVVDRSHAVWPAQRLEEVRIVENKLRLEGLTLTVKSVAKSVEFYSKTLGLEVGYVSEPAFAMIKIGEGTIGLLSVEEARKEGADESTPTQKRAIHVEFSTDDLDALYAELTTKGMVFHEPPHDEPWERVMTGFDPDGYSVEIAQGRRGQDGETWKKSE